MKYFVHYLKANITNQMKKYYKAMCRIFTDGGAASHFFVLNCASSGTVVEQ